MEKEKYEELEIEVIEFEETDIIICSGEDDANLPWEGDGATNYP